jgi:O-antigen ligase
MANSQQFGTRPFGERRPGKPFAAIASQGIVAGSSLVLQIIAFRLLGPGDPAKFALLVGILVTLNSVQSGWLGDSLTVLDRFDPGVRRALRRSQFAIVWLVFALASLLALPIRGIELNTALLFGFAAAAWALEETIRRLLIARREFTKLVVNDAAFALGSFGLVGFVAVSGGTFTLETLVLALLAGAVVAIGVGVAQLPSYELSRGMLGPSQMREVASFGIWRAAQVGLRPGSQTVIRAVIIVVASKAASDRLEAARLLVAPVLTIVNGAGVYLLPTYTAQAKAGRRFAPAVPVTMAAIAALAIAYGAIAVFAREPLTNLLLKDGSTAVPLTAILAWVAFSAGFGAGVPVGNAVVARGQSRTAFAIRVVDAALGVIVGGALALAGYSDAVPFGLALGTAVGAALLLYRLHRGSAPDATLDAPESSTRIENLHLPPDLRIDPTHGSGPSDGDELEFEPAAALLPPPRFSTSLRTARSAASTGADPSSFTGARRFHPRRALWLLPLIAIVATEYKIRRRDINEALGGSIDRAILVELALYGGLGLWAVWRLAPTRPRLTPLLVAMWGYVLTTATSSLYSTFPLLGLARGVQLVIVAAVVHALATDGLIGHISRLVHAWIVLITVSIGVGLVYVAPTTGPQVGRFTWLYVHSVSAGSMLTLSVTMLFGLWLSAGRRDNPIATAWPRWAYGALLMLHIVFLLATRTRGSIGGGFVALAVMAWVWSGQRAKPQLVLGSFVAGGAFLLAFGGPVLSFLTRGESAEKIGTFNRRTEIWTLAWDSFVSHPLQGLGFTSAKGVFFDETGLGGAHNALINVMIDTGLVGLTWWIALLVSVGVAINRIGRGAQHSDVSIGASGSGRSDRLILIGMLVASLINGITTEGLGAGVNVSAIWLYLMVAWLCVLHRTGIPDDTRVVDLARTHAT